MPPMTERTPLTVSAAFRERFEVLEVIGRGAFGVVLLANQKTLGRLVAVKYLNSTKKLREELEKRFLREAKVLSEMDHPNIVNVFEYGIDGEFPYLVQEYLKGRSLDVVLEREGSMDWRQVVAYGRQMAEGLAYAHEMGILHRDLKPANLFVTDNSLVEILDFGLAKAPGKHTTLTRTGSIVGTPVYMPPEMLRGQKSGPAGDVYSLGTTFYEMLTNALPYKTKTASYFKDKMSLPPRPLAKMTSAYIPLRLSSLVEAMLELEPENRPDAQKVSELLAEMAAMSKEELAQPSFAKRKRTSAEEESVITDAVAAPVITKPTPKPRSKTLPTLAAFAVVALFCWLMSGVWGSPPVKVLSFHVEGGIDSAHLKWQTDRKVATGVEHGLVGKDVTTLWSEERKTATRHDMVLTGLRPNNRYAITLLYGEGRRGPTKIFSTLPNLVINEFDAVNIAPTAATFKLGVSQPASVIFEVKEQKSGNHIATFKPKSKGPSWSFRATGLPAGKKFDVKARVLLAEHNKEETINLVTPSAKVHILFSGGVHREKRDGEIDIESLMHSKTKARAAPALYKDDLIFSHDKRGLFRLDLSRGKLVWSHKYNWYIDGLRVYKDLIFLVDRQKRVHCCLFATGKKMWQRTFTQGLESHFFAGPYGVIVWRKELGPIRLSLNAGEVLRPIDNAVLKPLWTISDEGKLFAFSEFFDLWCYDLKTGKRRNDLRVMLPQNMRPHPIALGEEIFAGLVDGSIVGGPPGKERRLNIAINERQIVQMNYEGETVYVYTRQPSGLHAASLKNGKRLWSYRPPSFIKTPLIARDGYLYYADKRNYLVCLHGATGRLLYQVYGNVMMQFSIVPMKDGALFCSSLLDISVVKDR